MASNYSIDDNIVMLILQGVMITLAGMTQLVGGNIGSIGRNTVEEMVDETILEGDGLEEAITGHIRTRRRHKRRKKTNFDRSHALCVKTIWVRHPLSTTANLSEYSASHAVSSNSSCQI